MIVCAMHRLVLGVGRLGSYHAQRVKLLLRDGHGRGQVVPRHDFVAGGGGEAARVRVKVFGIVVREEAHEVEVLQLGLLLLGVVVRDLEPTGHTTATDFGKTVR